MKLEKLKYKVMSNQLTSNIKLSEKQNDAFSLMKKGENIFLTGPSGCGKTSCVKLFIKLYKQQKIIGVTSTTGISALLFDGITLHSFLGIGLGVGTVESLCSTISKRSYLKKRWTELEVLIIDEISMLSPNLFDKIEEIARYIRRDERPFGGIQLILSGDMLQLPCVNSEDFCFESKSWDKCISKNNIVYLNKIMRQENKDFQECLNNIRVGELPLKTRKLLESRINVELKNDFGIKPTKIFSTNYSVDMFNNEELDKLAESGQEFFEYIMETHVYDIRDKQYTIEKYKKNCSAPAVLQLCTGAQVMLLFNLDTEGGLVNGSRGVISHFIRDIPVVKFLNGREIIIDYHIWEVEEHGKKILKSIQIPLRLAYACTIHRLQGSTLDYAEVDLGNIFEYGMAYVALSRTKNIEGLSISGIDFDKIKAHPKALKFYEDLNNTPSLHITPPGGLSF